MLQNRPTTKQKRMMTMDFKELRKLSGMTQKAFSEYFRIPLRNVEDWDRGIAKCKPYLVDLMLYKLKNEGIIKTGE
jgi:DNA-binding transcriptional regulator YiaG